MTVLSHFLCINGIQYSIHQATILGALATRLPAHLAGPQQVAFSKGEHSPGAAGYDP